MAAAERIVAIINPSSAPIKRLKEEARGEGFLVDATQGRKTRAILIMDSNHIILSGILDVQSKDVEAAAENQGLELVERMEMGDWVALAFRKE